MLNGHVTWSYNKVLSPPSLQPFCLSAGQDVSSPLQAFAQYVGKGGDKTARAGLAGDASNLPIASDEYVEKIKAKLKAVDGENTLFCLSCCGVCSRRCIIAYLVVRSTFSEHYHGRRQLLLECLWRNYILVTGVLVF